MGQSGLTLGKRCKEKSSSHTGVWRGQKVDARKTTRASGDMEERVGLGRGWNCVFKLLAPSSRYNAVKSLSH